DEVIATRDALTRTLKRSENKPDRREVRAAIVRFVEVYCCDPKRQAELLRRINFIGDECGDPEGQWHCPACGRIWPDNKQICDDDGCNTRKQTRITAYQKAVRSAFATFIPEPETSNTATQIVLGRLERVRRSHIQTIGVLQDARDTIRQAANLLNLFDENSRPQFERWHEECGRILGEALKLNVEGCFYLHSVWDADQIRPTEAPILSRQFLESLAPAKLDKVASAANSLVEWSCAEQESDATSIKQVGYLGLIVDEQLKTISRAGAKYADTTPVNLYTKTALWEPFSVLWKAGNSAAQQGEWRRLYNLDDRKEQDRRRSAIRSLKDELDRLDITISTGPDYVLIEKPPEA
ncbi:MAG: hypothetical protein WD648_14330, partial [Planctomycetaceae bacterium]